MVALGNTERSEVASGVDGASVELGEGDPVPCDHQGKVVGRSVGGASEQITDRVHLGPVGHGGTVEGVPISRQAAVPPPLRSIRRPRRLATRWTIGSHRNRRSALRRSASSRVGSGLPHRPKTERCMSFSHGEDLVLHALDAREADWYNMHTRTIGPPSRHFPETRSCLWQRGGPLRAVSFRIPVADTS